MTVFTAIPRFQRRLSDTFSTLKFDPNGLAHLYLKSAVRRTGDSATSTSWGDFSSSHEGKKHQRPYVGIDCWFCVRLCIVFRSLARCINVCVVARFNHRFSVVAACLNNLELGLGAVATNYHSLADLDKCILIFAMILGRLEIITLLVLFAPRYWRR